MARDASHISDSEWRVMEVLWQQGPCTTTQVLEALADTGWSRNTVATFLTRLEQKGFLTALDTSPRQYSPAVTRQEGLTRENQSFLHRVYHGSVGMLLASFIQDAQLSDRDAQQLHQLLDEAQARRDKEGSP